MKLLKFPDQDRVARCIETFGKELYFQNPQNSLYYQELVLIELINFYKSFSDDPYASGIAQEITKLRSIIEDFHGEFIE